MIHLLGVTRQTILRLKLVSEAYMFSTDFQQLILHQVSRRVIVIVYTYNRSSSFFNTFPYCLFCLVAWPHRFKWNN